MAAPVEAPARTADSVTEVVRCERSSPEVLPPTARETPRSDCHSASPFPPIPVTRRAYLTRLRYVFRLSQPLDVLFLSKPYQPYFVLVALMGFHLRRFPLARSCTNVITRRPAPLPVHRQSLHLRLRFRDFGIWRVRCRGRFYPEPATRASLGVFLPEVCSPSVPARASLRRR